MPRASLVRASLGRAELRRAALQQFTSENTLSVVNRGLLTSAATFTRADPATYFDSDGLLQTASAGEARTTYIDGVPYLLMEGARTNLLTRSEEFDHADWSVAGSASVTANQSEAPDGNTTADQLDLTASTNDWVQNTGAISGATAGRTFTFSVWVKTVSGSGVLQFNLVEEGGASSIGAMASSGSVNITNDWTRYDLSGSVTQNDRTGIRCRIRSAGSAESVYVWGAQLEEGEHESSYIKTTTASVTRAVDSASLANSIISGLTEGTIYAEVYSDHLTSDSARHIAELESDANNFIRVFHAADGDLDAQVTDGGVSQAALAGTDLTVGQLQKVALSFGPTGFRLVRGGTLLDSGTGTVPSVDTLLIGAGLYGGIHEMLVEPTEWSQAKAEALTT